MIDSYTRVIYGWKITNENKISSMINKLDEICSEVYHNDMYNILDNLIVEDTMCGEYLYFGGIIGSIDNDEDYKEIQINNDNKEKSLKKFMDMCEKYPEIHKVFKSTMNKAPQLYVFLHKW